MTRLRCQDHPAHLLTNDGFCLATSPPHKPGETLTAFPYSQPEEVPVDDATVTVLEQAARRLKDTNLSAVPDDELEVGLYGFPFTDEDPFAVDDGPAVIVDGVPVADITAAIEKAARDTWQPTLDDTLFPPVRKSDTPMVRVTISGTVELTQADYLAFLDGSRIGPGAVVEIRAAGYVVLPGAAWVKRTQRVQAVGGPVEVQTWHEREGRVKVKLTDLAGFAATGEEWSDG